MMSAIFILSHQRADRVETYSTLESSGANMDNVFVVIDDEDTQHTSYLERFGEHLIVFNKQIYVETVDTLETAKLRASAVYARNAVEDIARCKVLDAFVVFDDDITNLRFRWIEDDKAKSLKLNTKLDDVLNLYMEYLVSSNIATISFEHCMFYLGGISADKISNERWTYQIHFRNTKFPVDWISIINEDIITEISTAVRGYVWWSLPHVVYEAIAMNDKSGGVKDTYDALSDIKRAILAVVSNPSCCKVGYSHGKIRILQDKKSSYPMVVSSRYKR